MILKPKDELWVKMYHYMRRITRCRLDFQAKLYSSKLASPGSIQLTRKNLAQLNTLALNAAHRDRFRKIMTAAWLREFHRSMLDMLRRNRITRVAEASTGVQGMLLSCSHKGKPAVLRLRFTAGQAEVLLFKDAIDAGMDKAVTGWLYADKKWTRR